MSRGNFTNGSLVLRIWRFDGSSELTAKFQYLSDAVLFCEAKVAQEAERGANKDRSWFYLAVCEDECKAQAFDVKEAKQVDFGKAGAR